MDIQTDQLTRLLREQIEKFDGAVDVAEVWVFSTWGTLSSGWPKKG